MKKSGLWIALASVLLAIALYFLLPVFGAAKTMPRILFSMLPLAFGSVTWLILRLIRLNQALKARDSGSFDPQGFDSQLATPWLEPLRKETRTALDILRNSAKGKTGAGSNALEMYRFYLVMGAEGAGKSALLENSGIHFPRRFPAPADRARQTHVFSDWWMSGQGIFLEAPARYLSEEGNEELKEWMRMLQKDGKRPALDALLLTVNLSELLSGDSSADAGADRIRERVAAILIELRLELPVYLIFTHADILPGYDEFFENLKEPDSHQVMGATFALKGSSSPLRARFEREYRKLWETLSARVPYRLAQITDTQKKQKVFAFPNEFGAAQERLATFIEHLFKDTMAREKAMLRGFFFTSISQPALENIAQAAFTGDSAFHPLDVRAKIKSPTARDADTKGTSAPTARALFTELLFGGVLKSDRSLARIPGYRLGSLSRQALATALGLGLIGLITIIWGITGYAISTSRLERLAEAAENASRIRWNNPSSFDREFTVLSSVSGQLDSLNTGTSDSWLMPPGFGHTGAATEAAGLLHSVILERLCLRDAERSLAATLEMAAKYYNPSEHGALRDNLRLYLILTSEGKPHLADVDPSELSAALLGPAAAEVGHKMGAENLPMNFEAALEPHLKLWAAQFLSGMRPALDRTNAALVQNVRNTIVGNPSIEGLYESIAATGDPAFDLPLSAMGVPGDGILKSPGKVRSFYTRAGFEGGALDKLAEGAEQPHRKDWVVGEQASVSLPPEMQDRQKLHRALVDRYFQEYEAEWLRLLRSLAVQVPAEPSLAAGKLAGFASSNQGLPVVLNRLLAEVNLLAPPSAAEGEAMKKVRESKFNKVAQMAMTARDADKKALREKFRFVEELVGTGGTGGVLQDYLNSVRGLSEVLNRIALSGDGSSENLEAAQQLFQGKTDNPLNIAWMEASKTRTRYESQAWLGPLLESPVRDVAANLAQAAAQHLDNLYQSKVFPFYSQNLKGRYPLARNATLDVNMEDFKAFFALETGVFTSFVNGKLGPFVKRSDDGFTLTSWNGIRLPMTPAAVSALSRAQNVGRKVSGDIPGAFKIYNLNLTLPEIRNTTRITLRMGDDKISVAQGEGQARQSLRWPSETSYKGAELAVETPGGAQNRRTEGAFGLMKLLDGARALNLRPAGFSAKWRFTVAGKYDVDAALDANIPDRENPFSTPDFYRFELPPKIMSGSGSP